MASNPKYGVTYKTSDGKAKTISGINLGTRSYTEEQITAFIGILANLINKEVLSVDVTTASAIPPPEPPTPKLISDLTVEPTEATITAGDTATAEISITTDPPDATYSLSAPAAPEWVSIDDTTIVFTPDATTTAGNYTVTIQANTANDQKEASINIEIIASKETPVFEITNTSGTELDWKRNYYAGDTTKDEVLTYLTVKVRYSGQPRDIIFTGDIPKGRSGTRFSSNISTLNKRNVGGFFQADIRFNQTFSSSNPGAVNTGTIPRQWIFTLAEDDTFKEVTKTVTVSNTPGGNVSTYNNFIIKLKE